MSDASAAAASPKSGRGKRLIVTVAVYAAVLLAVELGARVLHPEAGRPTYAGYPESLIVPDTDLGHKYVPNFHGNFPNPRYQHIGIRTNGAGFRDDEWPARGAHRPPRVLVFGDSITFGSPIEENQRFTEIAAKTLADRALPITTMNVGVNGYNLQQYETLLETRGAEFAPDIVIVALCLNDAEPLAKSDAAVIEGKAPLEPNPLTDLRTSYAWALMSRNIRARVWGSARFGDKMAEKYNKDVQQELRELWLDGDGIARAKDAFLAMKAQTEGPLHASFATLVLPYHHQIERSETALTDKASALLDELKVRHLNLYPTFKQNEGADELYAYRDDCHPGIFGHKILGEAFARFLLDLDPIKTATQPPTEDAEPMDTDSVETEPRP
ncbi:MAG: SGNH/GDSL hydrolase family protein [Deltaproteobacteria bacterium]|nr:SGNH/GDSL hydrolase family protein [Deltaproteobacteria bacterium]